MKSPGLTVALAAIVTLFAVSTANAEDQPTDDAARSGAYTPPALQLKKGGSARENTHMVLTKKADTGRKSVVASVDQWRNDRKQIDITFTE